VKELEKKLESSIKQIDEKYKNLFNDSNMQKELDYDTPNRTSGIPNNKAKSRNS
jgi:hypothetical protein